jgi:hypothetical protein
METDCGYRKHYPGHDYGDVSGPIIWKVVTADLTTLEAVCHLELVNAMRAEGFDDDGLSEP